MFVSRLDLPAHTRKNAIALLQARLSDALDLEAQMKQAHWNAKGLNFFHLHEFFDKMHGEVEDMADTIAERITALGGIADGRIQTTANSTTLYEYSLEANGGVPHLKAIASALGQFAKVARQNINTATAFGDTDTADVFTEVSRATDKQLWLTEAHLAD